MDLNARYPAISDLRRAARRRLPRFVWEYLDSGTGAESAQARNRAALDRVLFEPPVLRGEIAADLSTDFLGQAHALPVGIAPVGMSGLIRPGAETTLARTAATAGIPYSLSTVATAAPEEVGPHLGPAGWFQLYPPRDPEIRRDMLARSRDAGFTGLVLTVDVPVASRRERILRSGLTQPPRLTPRVALQCAIRPTWALQRLRHGMPHMATLDPYSRDMESRDPTAHIGYLLRTAPDWDYLHWLRDHWQGHLIVKGVLRGGDASRIEEAGVDAIWISNHAGRQFDGGPAAIDALPRVRAATDLPLIFDSGIEGGLDILRAMALGADFTMLGRAFHYALSALGEAGPAHLVEILKRDLIANLGQLGLARPGDVRGLALSLDG
ncbi:alpha-hydroxy acid oxidase [Allosediminivita pacifica]|uniref:L-lactate dehydrogenase (Cytochrome) n=1 Tax=Allosediminivita pacifica TaxID=1267769 RepID=A0A2T6B113_9RHOB|nr:alpha-hydroxy acid oxidase [Allosediminivita pacifica]PTX49713.1 L-lactate dehydrogenase (cytochrome) [Allosediminivita pacifica]